MAKLPLQAGASICMSWDLVWTPCPSTFPTFWSVASLDQENFLTFRSGSLGWFLKPPLGFPTFLSVTWNLQSSFFFQPFDKEPLAELSRVLLGYIGTWPWETRGSGKNMIPPLARCGRCCARWSDIFCHGLENVQYSSCFCMFPGPRCRCSKVEKLKKCWKFGIDLGKC